MIETLVELVVSLAIEILAPVAFSAIGQVFGEPVRDILSRPTGERRPSTALAWAALGLLVGALSVWAAPRHLFASRLARVANFLLAPLLAGAALAWLDVKRNREPGAPLRDPWLGFVCGYAFALCFAGVRAIWAG